MDKEIDLPTVNAFIQQSHDNGDDIITVIKAVRNGFGVDLGVAKRLVEAHPKMLQAVENNRPLHEAIDEMMNKLDQTNNTDPG